MNNKSMQASSRTSSKKTANTKAKSQKRRATTSGSSARSTENATDAKQSVAALPQSEDGPRNQSVPSRAAIPLPLATKALFWPPRHAALSKDIFHVPLLFWLIETVRPLRVVQLGLQDPGGYLAVCQAMDRLGLDGQCWAVAGREEADALIASPQEHNHNIYADFSSILTCSHAHVAHSLRDAGIDLLVLDMSPDDPDLAGACDLWLPLLSDRGVIVLRQKARDDENQAGTPESLAALSADHPVFQSRHDDWTLRVILHGQNQPERLLHLASLDLGMSGHLAVRQVFTRLGQGLVDGQSANRLQREREAMQSELRALKIQVSELGNELEQKQAEVSQTREAMIQLQRQYNERQAELFDHTRAASETKASAEDTVAEKNMAIAELREKLDQAADRQQKYEAKLEALETNLAEAERDRAQAWKSFDELRAEHDAYKATSKGAIAEKNKSIASLGEETAQPHRENEAQAQQLDKVQTEIEEMRREAFTAQQLAESLKAELYGARLVWETREQELLANLDTSNRDRAEVQTKLDRALERRSAILRAHELLKAEYRALTATSSEAAATGPAQE